MNQLNFDGVLQSGNLEDTYQFTLEEQTNVEINGTSFTSVENFDPAFDSALNPGVISIPISTPAYRVRFRLGEDANGNNQIDNGEVIGEPLWLPSSTVSDPMTSFAGALDAGDYLIELTPTGTLASPITDPSFSISYELDVDLTTSANTFSNSNNSGNGSSNTNSQNDSIIDPSTDEGNTQILTDLQAGLSAPAFADLDADGDVDAFIGDANGEIYYLQNDGSGSFSETTGVGNPLDDFGVSLLGTPAFADIDSDGDLDAFIGSRDGTVKSLINDGNGVFTEVAPNSNPFRALNRGRSANTRPTFADIDSDGDADAFIGVANGTVRSFENDGDGNFTELTGGNNPLNGVVVQADSAPTFADIDGDGDLDALVGSSDGTLNYFQNDGEDGFSEVSGANNPFDDLDVGRTSTPTFADLNGDGTLELVVGASNGTVSVFESGILAPEDLATQQPVGDVERDFGTSLIGEEAAIETGSISDDNPVDFYAVSVISGETIDITLEGLASDANLAAIEDVNSNNIFDVDVDEIYAISNLGGVNSESISLDEQGDYLVAVYQYSGNTEYVLQFDQEFGNEYS